MKTHLLGDDGTLDTVLICEECEQETRYNFAFSSFPEGEQGYAEFVHWAIQDADEDHDCPALQEGDTE